MNFRLKEMGWDSFFEKHFELIRSDQDSPMRIIRENRGKYLAFSELGELNCEVSGKFRFESESKSNFPTVGDWVLGTILPDEKKQ